MKKMRNRNNEGALSTKGKRSHDGQTTPSYVCAGLRGELEHMREQVGLGRRQFLLGSLFAMASCFTGRVAFARGRFCRPIKIAHHFPQNTIVDRWAMGFKARLVQIDEKIEVEIIPQQPPLRLIDGFLKSSSDSFDLILVSAEAVSVKIPEWRVLILPALYPSLGAVKRLRQQKAFLQMLEKFPLKGGSVLITLGWNFFGIATSTVGIRTPDDMKGLKIQAWQEDWKSLLEAANVLPTKMSYGEVYTALKARTIDGTIASHELFRPLGLENAIKNLTWSAERSVFSRTIALISNQWFWEKTGKDLQPKLLQIGSDSATSFEESYQKANIDAIENVRKAGVKIIDLSEEDFRKWVDLSKGSAWKKYEQEVEAGKELVRLVQQGQQNKK